MFRQVLMMLLISGSCSAVIYTLNESEYNRMPRLFHLDDFDACMLDAGGTYCVATLDLFSENDSDLMRMIQGYSEHSMKHFNHTKIHRGVCITSTCTEFMKKDTLNTTQDLAHSLEACLNDSLWTDYKLQGKLGDMKYCKKESDRISLDNSDIIVAVVYLVLIILNVVGSFYDVLKFEKGDNSGNPYLLSFSLRRNWGRLVAPINTDKEPRLERLRLFHGLRTMTMVCVIFSHTVLMLAFGFVDNPLYIEKSYEDPLKQILYNGSLVTHTFFVMSSFLMAYNLQLYSEKHSISWVQWPKGVLLRWLRLTPTYALILATISTWMRYAGSGPLWDLIVSSESSACRQYWWTHILYINNYIYEDAYCAPQTWYLAADTQLFCVCLLVCVVVRTPRARIVALSLMMLLSFIIAAAHTYFQDLDAVVIQSPESYRNLYETDATFRLLYIRGHTNLSTYTLGLAGGFFTYYFQTEKKQFQLNKKYRWGFWLLFPAGVAVILSGAVFYSDGEQPSTALRVLYATFYKPLFQFLVVSLIIGCIYKIDSVYRGIVEWRGFTWAGRVSYCAFLLHTLFLRALAGGVRAPVHMNDYGVMVLLCATIFLTFMCAAMLWLLVEAPLAGVIRALQGGGGNTAKEGEGNETHGERSKV